MIWGSVASWKYNSLTKNKEEPVSMCAETGSGKIRMITIPAFHDWQKSVRRKNY